MLNTTAKVSLGLFLLAPLTLAEKMTGVTSLAIGPLFLWYVFEYHLPLILALSFLQLLQSGVTNPNSKPGARFVARYFYYTLLTLLAGWCSLCACYAWFPRTWILAVLVRWIIQFGPLVAPSALILRRSDPEPLDLGRLIACIVTSIIATLATPESSITTFIDELGRTGR